MTKRVLSALALAAALAAAAVAPQTVVKWGTTILGGVSEVVAIGPFIDAGS